jgi:hypothetical protein
MEEIPLGVGIDYNLGRVTAGFKGLYRFLINDEFAEPTPAEDNPSGGLASASLTLGGTF